MARNAAKIGWILRRTIHLPIYPFFISNPLKNSKKRRMGCFLLYCGRLVPIIRQYNNCWMGKKTGFVLFAADGEEANYCCWGRISAPSSIQIHLGPTTSSLLKCSQKPNSFFPSKTMILIYPSGLVDLAFR